jgi:hypothetical protein
MNIIHSTAPMLTLVLMQMGDAICKIILTQVEAQLKTEINTKLMLKLS